MNPEARNHTFIEFADVIYEFSRLGYPAPGEYYQDPDRPWQIVRAARRFTGEWAVRIFIPLLTKTDRSNIARYFIPRTLNPHFYVKNNQSTSCTVAGRSS